ncbi:MAG: AbrB/MazE/SpoVT family DNA-binding domain-containing protein [Bifidobacteriaceae bacterium]|jgi:AbrB family looped-hinge helix DNA binding protein|nr:AbrB/MazE/SpoVT family DNA-binding domain-containing protein [Bifidobacteriaceae bacterium]
MNAHSSRGRGFPPRQICGTATVGERGQVVIPAEARKSLGIEPGDRFVVFGNKLQGSVVFVKAEAFTKVAEFFVAKADKLGQMGQEWIDRLNGLYDEDDVDDAAGSAPADGVGPDADQDGDGADGATASGGQRAQDGHGADHPAAQDGTDGHDGP